MRDPRSKLPALRWFFAFRDRLLSLAAACCSVPVQFVSGDCRRRSAVSNADMCDACLARSLARRRTVHWATVHNSRLWRHQWRHIILLPLVPANYPPHRQSTVSSSSTRPGRRCRRQDRRLSIRCPCRLTQRTGLKDGSSISKFTVYPQSLATVKPWAKLLSSLTKLSLFVKMSILLRWM